MFGDSASLTLAEFTTKRVQFASAARSEISIVITFNRCKGVLRAGRHMYSMDS